MQTSTKSNVTKQSDKDNIVCNCPHCGAKMKMYWQRLGKGLVTSLVKFKQKVIVLNANRVHLQKDLNLTNNAYTNFQKLRYHGLIAHYTNPETKRIEPGYWLLTRRGNQFLRGEIVIPFKVQTFRNKIWDKDSRLISISEILNDNSMPYWDQIENFTFDFADIMEVEEIVFNAVTGQGELTFK